LQTTRRGVCGDALIFSAIASRNVGNVDVVWIGFADVGAELLAQALCLLFRQMHSALVECRDGFGTGAIYLLFLSASSHSGIWGY
jgi:hypothetical protein